MHIPVFDILYKQCPGTGKKRLHESFKCKYSSKLEELYYLGIEKTIRQKHRGDDQTVHIYRLICGFVVHFS